MKHRRGPGLIRLWTLPCGAWDTSPLPARSSKPRGQESGEGQGTWWLLCPRQLPAHTQPLPKSTAHLGSFRRWALPCQAHRLCLETLTPQPKLSGAAFISPSTFWDGDSRLSVLQEALLVPLALGYPTMLASATQQKPKPWMPWFLLLE